MSDFDYFTIRISIILPMYILVFTPGWDSGIIYLYCVAK